MLAGGGADTRIAMAFGMMTVSACSDNVKNLPLFSKKTMGNSYAGV